MGCNALLIKLILFGMYMYNTQLFHHVQGDWNWLQETHEGVTKSNYM